MVSLEGAARDNQQIEDDLVQFTREGNSIKQLQLSKDEKRAIETFDNDPSVFRTVFLRVRKFLPVKQLSKLHRGKLIAPIDSLSVYQYLNQGTFRPVFRIGDKRKIKHLDRVPCLPTPKLEKHDGGNLNLDETDLGKFVRLCVDYISGESKKIPLLIIRTKS